MHHAAVTACMGEATARLDSMPCWGMPVWLQMSRVPAQSALTESHGAHAEDGLQADVLHTPASQFGVPCRYGNMQVHASAVAKKIVHRQYPPA